MPAPTTRIMRLTGRSAAARSIRSRSPEVSGAGGPDLGLRRSVTVVHRWYQTHLPSDLERERLGGTTLVYGEAQAPVGIRDEHQLAGLGRPESFDVPDRHLAVSGVYSQSVAVLQPRLILHYGEPRVAEAVDGDNVGDDPFSLVYECARRAQ